MRNDESDEARQARELEERLTQQSERLKEWWSRQAEELGEESLRQNSLMYGGLIGIGIVMVQPFLTEPSLSIAALVCVVSFSVAIPVLAALVLLNQQEIYRRRRTTARIARIGESLGFASAFIGIAAGFWHISPIAGVTILVSAIIGLIVHSSGYVRLEKESAPDYPEPDAGTETEAGP